MFVLPNQENHRCVNNWDRRAQSNNLEQQSQTSLFLLLPTYKIVNQFFTRKFQFLDSFLAPKYVQLFSSQLPSLTHTGCVHWEKIWSKGIPFTRPCLERIRWLASKRLPVRRAPLSLFKHVRLDAHKGQASLALHAVSVLVCLPQLLHAQKGRTK